MRRVSRLIFLLILLLFMPTCDYMEPEVYQPEYVVESVLIANMLLPEVNIFKTAGEEEDFEWGNARVEDAIVEIHLMDNKGKTETKYSYYQEKRGIYQPESKELVKAARVYEIKVVIPDDENHELWARTIVPGDVKVITHPEDTVVYQSNSLVTVDALVATQQGYKAVLMNTYKARKAYYKNLTPYYASQADSDTMSTYYDYHNHTQEMVSEANYPRNPDQSLRIHFPWKEFPYYGPYLILIQSLDDNLYDHFRSANAQFGGGNMAPGQIYNAIEHVEGGIGVFGSMSVDTIYTYLKKPE